MIRRLLVVAFFLVGSACTSSGDEAVTATSVETTTTTAATTTSVETTTSTSTTAEPDWTAEELEVIAAYEAYMSLWSLAESSIPDALNLLEDWGTGEIAVTARSGLERLEAAGQRVKGSWVVDVRQVDVAGETATIVDCGLDAVVVLASDGSVVSPADDQAYLDEVTLVQEDGRWKVALRESSDPPVACS